MEISRIRSVFAALFRRHSPATVREGSVIMDQIVGPLAIYSQPIYSAAARLIDQLTLPDPKAATQSDVMRALGQLIGIAPIDGTRSRAQVRLVIRNAQRIDVPEGAQFLTAEGKPFRTERAFVFPEGSLSSTTWNGTAAYETPAFDVVSDDSGPKSVVAAEAINIPGLIVPGLLGVYNPAASSGAVSAETLGTYKERLRRASSSRGTDTKEGALFAIPATFGSSVQDMTLVRPGDPEMERDVTYTRRLIGSTPIDASLTMTRSSGTTTSLGLTVNGNTTNQGVSSEVTIIHYDADDETFVVSRVATTGLLAAIQSIPRGHYVFAHFKAGWATEGDIPEFLAEIGGSLNPENNTTLDYVFFFSKGHHTVSPRQLSSNPANGTATVTFSLQQREISVESESIIAGFEGKVQGKRHPNPNRILKRRPTSEAANLSTPAEEVSQEEYALVSTPDFEGVIVDTDVLWEADFVRTAHIVQALGPDWVCGNTGEPLTTRDSAGGIQLYKGSLVLSPLQFNPLVIDGVSLSLPVGPIKPVTELQRNAPLYRKVRDVRAILQNSGVNSLTINQVVNSLSLPEVVPVDGYRGKAGNTSPVVMRRVADEHGFRISGSFWTTDTGKNPAAITMARTNPDQGGQFRWYEGFGIALSCSDAEGQANVFVIDNGASDREMTVVGEEFVGGKLDHNVLAQTSAPINPETKYRYEIIFGAPAEGEAGAVSLTARIWQDGQTKPVAPTISYGAYVPTNRRDQLLFAEGDNLRSTAPNTRIAEYMGIGVSKTDAEHYWKFDDLSVHNVDREFAQAILEFDVMNADTSLTFMLVARARGYDTGTLSEKFGHKVFAWNVVTTQWEEIASYAYDDFLPYTTRFGVDLQNRISSNIVRLLVSATHPHQGAATTPTTSLLELDHISGGAYSRIVHTGGKSDVWFFQEANEDQRPSEIRTHEFTGSRMVEIDPASLGGPIEEVISVEIMGGAETIVLDPADYRFFWRDEALRGSMRERLVIVLDPSVVGLDLQITARVHTLTPSLHNFLLTSASSKLDADLLARHKQSVFVDVSGEVEGTITAAEMLVKAWVSGYTAERMRLADLVDYLYSEGATSVSLTGAGALTISARRINADGNTETVSSDTLTRQRIERFVPGSVTLTTLP
jgi:hypothetical protein